MYIVDGAIVRKGRSKSEPNLPGACSAPRVARRTRGWWSSSALASGKPTCFSEGGTVYNMEQCVEQCAEGTVTYIDRCYDQCPDGVADLGDGTCGYCPLGQESIDGVLCRPMPTGGPIGRGLNV